MADGHPRTANDRAQPESAAALRLECRLSTRIVLPGQESQLRLLVEAAAAPAAVRRPDLNVCLAIDRSFSMAEDHKLERAKEAAFTFISALAPNDIFSLVEFGTDVRVAAEARAGVSHDELQRAVMAIKAHSATNLHGALHAAGAEVMRGVSPGRLNRVILLSDGVPTEGITSDREILDVVRMARALGISITTIGLGEDYDEVLLSQISEISGGNHYYVETPDDIRRSLVREVGRMASLAARDLLLSVEPGPGAEIALANGRFNDRCSREGGGLQIALDDMERGGVQPILFTLNLPALAEGTALAAAVRLKYRGSSRTNGSDSSDESGHEPRVLTSEVKVGVSADTRLIRESIDRHVLRKWEELDAVQTMAAAIDSGRTGAAPLHDVARTLHVTADRLTRVGSARASLVARLERTVVEQGEISSELAKRTIIERMAAQQGEQPEAGGEP